MGQRARWLTWMALGLGGPAAVLALFTARAPLSHGDTASTRARPTFPLRQIAFSFILMSGEDQPLARHAAQVVVDEPVINLNVPPNVGAPRAWPANDVFGNSNLSLDPTPVAAPAVVLQQAKAMPQPILADAASDEQDVYSLPAPPAPGQGTNLGGVNIDLTVNYLNHYVYRGVDHSISGTVGGVQNSQHSKSSTLNLQIDGKLSFDLGNFPHPFVGLFSDVYDADPKSRFQEIRPFYGLDLTIRPFILEGGGNTYIFPEREHRNTAEAYGKITLDDSFLFNTDKPQISPYIYGAYDYDKNNGWYFEAGASHDVTFEDLGLVLTFQADLAYIIGYQQQFVFIDNKHDTGFQHYDVGLTGAYSLNRLFDFSNRYGTFDLMGYLFYTGRLDHDLRADNVLWGGAGIRFQY